MQDLNKTERLFSTSLIGVLSCLGTSSCVDLQWIFCDSVHTERSNAVLKNQQPVSKYIKKKYSRPRDFSQVFLWWFSSTNNVPKEPSVSRWLKKNDCHLKQGLVLFPTCYGKKKKKDD